MIKSIISLYENANDPSRIELLLKLDDDNYKEYIDRIDEIYKITQNVKIVISNRRKGYNSLHHFVNELCGVSTGEFLLLWNDDATMITNEWDNYVVEHSGEVCVLQMDNNHFPDIFPLVHRKIYEVLGHFSLNPQNDSWIHFVAQMADIEKDEFRIIAHHDRADILEIMMMKFIGVGLVHLKNIRRGGNYCIVKNKQTLEQKILVKF